MQNPKVDTPINVSVLVPVYGVEKFIERCARSLFNQTMTDDIEFIFVNDGTPDNSIGILKDTIREFPEREKNIRIINHDGNKGLAVARVTGVKAARGEYVIHCDSDDWVEPDMYRLMYESAKANDADIVVCGYFTEAGERKGIHRPSLLSGREERASNILRIQKMHQFLWQRLVRKEYYDKYDFKADPAVTYCEDFVVTVPMHLFTDKVSVVAEPLYHYNCVNPGSMTQVRDVKRIEAGKLALDMLEEFIVKHNHPAVLPALQYRKFLYYLPLITCLECYDPKRWLELDNPQVNINLMLRSRVSVWLVRHKLPVVNRLFQLAVRKLFKR